MPLRAVQTIIAALLVLAGIVAAPDARSRPGDKAVIAAEVRAAWGFDKSDLTPDPAIRFGVLANGMRYAIMPNETPRQAVSVRLRFDVGAAAEAEGQGGVAHLLEHMAFLGSRRFPEGLGEAIGRIGLLRPEDANAFTSYTETVYLIDLPRADPPAIDTALLLMRETASELTLTPEAIDRARPVVIAELLARDGVEDRLTLEQTRLYAPGAATGREQVAGSEEEVTAADAATVRSFYELHYSPERATLVVVGDVDPEAVEARIAERFGDWRARARGPARPAAALIDRDRPTEAALFVNLALPTTVSIAAAAPIDDGADTAARRERNYREYLASEMFSRRLARLAARADGPFVAASAGIFDWISSARVARIELRARERDWRRALETGEQELRRALQHGFTQAELSEQLAIGRRALAVAAETRQTPALADAIVAGLETGLMPTAPQNRTEAQSFLGEMNLADVDAAFRAAWAPPGRLIFVGHDRLVPRGERAVLQAWAASARVEVAAPASAAVPAFAYDDFGPPGRVVADARIADLGIRTVRFANNVRLNVKRTDFEPRRVRVSLRVGGGLLEFPQQPDGLAPFGAWALSAGDTARHGSDELETIFAGRAVAGAIELGDDSFGGVRETTAEDLDAQLALLAATVADPGYRTETEALWPSAVDTFLPAIQESPGGVLLGDAARLLAGGDTRFGFAAEDALRAANLAALRAVVAESFARGPIEIGIVGDVNEDQAIAAVARSFGALPARMRNRPDYSAAASRGFPTDRRAVTLHHGGAPSLAAGAVYWPVESGGDARDAARIELLRSLLAAEADAVLRERLGATYGAQTELFRPAAWPGYGHLSVHGVVDPARVEALIAAIDGIAQGLAATAPAADPLERARRSLIEGLRRRRQENGGWIEMVGRAQSDPAEVARFRDAEAALAAVTAAELQQAARAVLRPDAALRIRILPPGRN